jgi:hypothetical protein
MRTLLIGALSATLVSCSSLEPTQTSVDKTAAATRAESKSTLFIPPPTPKVAAKTAKPSSARPKPAATKVAATTVKPSPAQAGNRTDLAEEKPHTPKAAGASAGQPAETVDPVLKKAKITVASKMEDPASAEFGDMKRAMRKNTFGQPLDTICGRVKGKKPSGEDTGDRPFLYLVNEDEAYVVSGSAISEAAIAYRNICN